MCVCVCEVNVRVWCVCVCECVCVRVCVAGKRTHTLSVVPQSAHAQCLGFRKDLSLAS